MTYRFEYSEYHRRIHQLDGARWMVGGYVLEGAVNPTPASKHVLHSGEMVMPLGQKTLKEIMDEFDRENPTPFFVMDFQTKIEEYVKNLTPEELEELRIEMGKPFKMW